MKVGVVPINSGRYLSPGFLGPFGRLLEELGFESAWTFEHVILPDHYESRYPYNPSGSPHGITGLTTADGRFTIVMPHPERVFRTVQMSWAPDRSVEDSPWMRMFYNARKWVG